MTSPPNLRVQSSGSREMRLFIDTNILLSFYHLTSDDLVELEKLVKLIEDKELTLIVTQQVIEETLRNRANKINEGLSEFKKTKIKFVFPAYCKDYPQYKEIQTTQKNIEKLHADLISQIDTDIKNNNLKADKLIEKLFSVCIKIPHNDDCYEAAKKRIELGNPPGKKGSMRDALNWESLLKKSPKNIDIHLITDDKDYICVLNTDELNNFMKNEWVKTKSSNIYFYRKLSEFFKEHFSDINLSTEEEKDRYIEQLSSSSSFAETHNIIAKLETYENFTQKQAEDMSFALVSNPQINRIIGDSDVYNFYKKIDKKYFLVSEKWYEEFEKTMETSSNTLNEDLPF